MTPDPYQALGVAKGATAAQIKSAYRRLAQKNHPDKNPGNKAAESRFKDISNAHALLSDSAKRRQFDAGEIDADGNPRGGFSSSHGYDTYRRSAPNNGGFGFGTGHSAGGKSRFSDFFRDRTNAKAKGADVSYTLKVPLVDAAAGTTTSVRMASGKILKVTIPPGTENGQVLRLKGQGMPGIGGGGAGAALVEVLIEQGGAFTANGLDIHCEEPVTLDEAMLGARIEVQTIHGPLLVTVPENSNTDTKLRLKGKGTYIPKTGKRGDHYVSLKVVLPEGEDSALKAFVRKWAAKNPYSVRKESLKRTTTD